MIDSPPRKAGHGNRAQRENATITGSLGLAALFVGMLVALSYPVLTAAIICGTLVPGLVRRAKGVFDRIRPPSTSGRIETECCTHS